MKRLVLFISLLAVGTPVYAAGTGDPEPPESIQSLSDSIEALVRKEGIPGVAVALVLPSGRIWSQGFGVARRSSERPMTDSTLFRVGSNSKMFIGAAALQQQERGHLDLRDKLRVLAPDLKFENPWAEERPVRLVHLLEHTSGFDGTHPAEIYAPKDSMSLRPQVNYHPHSQVVRWPPGRFSAYSDPGMNAAAYAIQRALKSRFVEYVEEEIFNPLRMSSATYDREDAHRRDLAAGYGTSGSDEAMEYRPMLMRPAVGAKVHVRDMGRFMKMLLQDGRLNGHRLLEPASVRRMETPKTTLASKQYDVEFGTGLGNNTEERNGFVWHGHSAFMEGHVTKTRYLDARERGYAVFFNVYSADHWKIENLVARYLTQDLSAASPKVTSTDRLRLSSYEGYYVSVAPRYEALRFIAPWTRVLRTTATKLVLNVEPTLLGSVDPVRNGDAGTWLPVSEGQFRSRNAPVATHAFVTTGRGQYLQINGGGGGTFRRVSAGIVWAWWGLSAVVLGLLLSSILFAGFWGTGLLLGRLELRNPLQVRLWPLLATLSVAFFFAGLAAVLHEPAHINESFAQPNLYTLSMVWSSVSLAIFSVLGVVQGLRHYRTAEDRLIWWHSFLTSMACSLVAGWLAYHGFIGIRVWSY